MAEIVTKLLAEKCRNETAAAVKYEFSMATGEYNEWRVTNTEVVGVYFEPSEIGLTARKKGILRDSDTGAVVSEEVGATFIDEDEILNTFSELPCITRADGRFVFANTVKTQIYGL